MAFITNRGFEDMLEIGRQARPDLYNLDVERPRPLAARHLRFGIAGRVDAAGRELEPIHLEDLESIWAAVEAGGVEAAAICLLHAYANSAHEE